MKGCVKSWVLVNGRDVFRPGFVVNGRDVSRTGFVL